MTVSLRFELCTRYVSAHKYFGNNCSFIDYKNQWHGYLYSWIISQLLGSCSCWWQSRIVRHKSEELNWLVIFQKPTNLKVICMLRALWTFCFKCQVIFIMNSKFLSLWPVVIIRSFDPLFLLLSYDSRFSILALSSLLLAK